MLRQFHRRTVRRSLGAAVAVVCLGLVPLGAQTFGAPEGAATVKVLSGRVDVMRDSTPWALNLGDVVKPRQVIVTGSDGYAVFQVSDGSTFEVFPNSNATFRDNLGDWRDLLEVWIGRVKVHIQKLTGGRGNQNRVGTPTAVISVKGTVFHVNVEDEGGTTLVTVEEGLVTVRHKMLPGKEIPLNPGESIRVLKNEPLALRLVDKGTVAKSVANAVSEALYRIVLGRRPGAGGGTSPTGGTAPADEKAPDPPPPPPPPPGPPPP